MRIRFILFYTVFLFTAQALTAQYYDTGQDPASLKWKQIKTSGFTIIFPENYSQGGILYAKSLNESLSKLSSLFPDTKFRLPVLIHNFTIQSNGYVAWAPKRMELYPTPDQNTIPLAPETQLTVHELTHVLQMESLNQGFSKGMSYLLGQQFTGIVASLLPSWFLEGDAVFAESALTPSGRGRTPAFQKQLKALIVDDKKFYNYDKILNGSFKDFVPDYYESGYQMVTWALTRNEQIWNKVLKFTADQPFTLNPVNISLTRIAGLRKKTLWIETFDSLKTIWTKDIHKEKPSDYKVENPDKHGRYISYYSPVLAGRDSIIAIKTSLSAPSSFVLIKLPGKTEKRIHTPGQVYPNFISYARSKLVWVETEQDHRWANREFSVIKLMDLKSGRVVKLTRKSRYLAASISPDGSQIAAVENSVRNVNDLVLLNARTGEKIRTIQVPENIYLQHPQWSEEGRKITFISLSDAGEGVISFDPENQKWETLVEAGRNDLQSSFLRNDSLFYVSSSSGTDNVYLLSPGKETTEITNSRFGLIDVSPGANNLIFSDYTYLGNNICIAKIPVTSGTGRRYVNSSSFLINRFNIKPPPVLEDTSMSFTPVPYRKWEHLFRFHSWMPFYANISNVNIDPASLRPGVTILTQNTLSTLISTLGYEYSSDKRNVIHSRISWKGWYPVIESQLDYGALPGISKMGADIANPSHVQPAISFLNTIYLPLQFTSGRFSELLQPSVSSDYLNNYIYIKERGTFDYGQTIITTRLYFSNYDRSAIRDIYPKWAQVMDFNYCFAPFDKLIYGSSVSLRTAFYFPGLLPNNGIRLRLETEVQDPQKYLYENFSSLPRGYSDIISKKINFLSVDYVMPLVYPDFNVASLLYIKRIRTSLFYDYAFGPGNSMYKYGTNGLVPIYQTPGTESLKSFGCELLADFHVLRIPYMISGGIQSAWTNIRESPSLRLLFNIDLYGMTFGRRKL